MKPRVKIIDNQSSWIIGNDSVEMAVTELGGMMAPVTFCKNTKSPVTPYYISPWQTEPEKAGLPVLEPLRGDFFCMPFGGGSIKNEEHTPHGETATSKWKLKAAEKGKGITSIELTLKTKVRPGIAAKKLSLVDGQNVVYAQHCLEGYSGKMCLGHHQTLALPEQEGSLRVSTSPIHFGMIADREHLCYAGKEYSSLAPGGVFKNLNKVPTIWKEQPFADLSAFPAREGFVDIAAVYQKTGTKPAWTTAAVPSLGYLWFSLKDPKVLPQTVMWISNCGRHAHPWNGRNRCLGLEDTCSMLAEGLANSVKKNVLTEQGIPTSVTFSPKKPTVISTIQGVVQIPKTFDRVKTVKFGRNQLTFGSFSGKEVTAPVFWDFVETGVLQR